MKYLTSSVKNAHTVYVQNIGFVYGTLCSELKEGDTILGKGMKTIKIKAFKESSSKSRRMILEDGSRKRAMPSLIIPRPFEELPIEIKERINYPKTFENFSQFHEYFKVFDEDKRFLESQHYKTIFEILRKQFKGLTNSEMKSAIEYLKENKTQLLGD